MSEFTFLTIEQFYSLENDGIFDGYGEKARITDFASLLGCYRHKDGIGEWWTKTPYHDIEVYYGDDEYDDDFNDELLCVINEDGKENFKFQWERFAGGRPAFSISSVFSKESKKKLEDSGVKEFGYGEYPQTIVDEEYSKELERLYSSNSLIITGRNYTTDSAEAMDDISKFKAKMHIEYEYNGRQYIRFVYDDSSVDGFNLSDGRKLERGKIYWVAVEPIVWLLDLKADIALSKKVIFSGVQFESSSNNEKIDFERSTIKKFMDKCLSKEIVADRTYPKVTFESQTQENIESKKLAEKQISDAINFVGNSEEDTESRELVENQTSNEFNFVDNLEESTENKELVEEQVSNTSNFDDVSREDVDSEESVANKISDDFDFVNVLEENIENKEPDETQIFGAINFDNNSEEETETKIHPYVYAYIMYKSYSGYDVLSNRLNYWKMVSELLYKTKKLEILPDTLKKLIGDELSKDFIAFISQQVISKEDVLSYNYSSEDLKMSASQFFATLAELLFVDVKYIETVRCFEEKIKLDTSGMKSGTVFEFENWTEFSKRFEANEKLKEIKNCYVEKSVEQVSDVVNFDNNSRENTESKVTIDSDFDRDPEENAENKELAEKQISDAINFDNNSEEETETKIHPYVYAYIMYKSYSGYDVLSNRLNYWKMVSELLYKTKKLEILPDTLKKLIGDELSKDFIAFISQQVISKEDVLSYNYSSEDLKMSASQFFATLAELLFVDVKYIETVRCFEEKIKLDTSGMKSGTVFEFENWTEFSKRFEANEKLKEIKNCYVEKSVEQVSDVVNFDNNSRENTESKVTIDSDFDRDPEENAENKELAEKQISDAINFDNNSEKNTESKESVANKTSDDFNCDSEEEVETKIHPYVSAYMAYKAYNENKLNVDSKKWQMASKVLFETKELLSELLGDDIAKDFIAFTRQQVISLEDVINHNYSSKDLEMSVFQKFATAAELSLVDDEHLEKVKDFMKQVDGSIKMKTVFENLSDLEKKFEKNEKSREIKPYQEKKSVEQVSNTSNFDDVSRDGVDNKEVVKNRNSNNFNYSNVSKEETETKIYPYVYTYILYKSYSGYDVLSNRLKYWENVSELLYKTNQSEILPDMLRKLLGDELAEDFIAFTNQQVISLEDVINHNYSSEDLEMSVSQKFATVAELCSADNEYFEVVRDFMNQADAEMGAVFESWTDLKGRFETSCRNEENKEIPERKAKVRRKKKN